MDSVIPTPPSPASPTIGSASSSTSSSSSSHSPTSPTLPIIPPATIRFHSPNPQPPTATPNNLKRRATLLPFSTPLNFSTLKSTSLNPNPTAHTRKGSTALGSTSISGSSTGRRNKSVLNVERLHRIMVFELLSAPIETPITGATRPPPGRYRSMRLRDLYNYVQRTIAGEFVTFEVNDTVTSGERSGNVTKQQRRRSISFSENVIIKQESGSGGGSAPVEAVGGEGAKEEEKTVLGGYLHPRDMRRMVTPFSPSNQPAVIVRRHVILLNFDPLRVILLRDRMLLLVPDGADSILAKLEKSIRGDQNAKVDEVFGNNTKDDDETSRHSDDKTATPNGANTTPLTTLFPATAAAPPPSPATPSSSPVAGRRTSFVSFFQKRNAEVSSPTLNDVEEGIELEEGDEPDSPPISEEEFSDDDFDMEDDMEGVEDAPPPFELVCLDSVLQAATGILQGDFTTLEQKVLTAMEDLRGDHMNKNGKLNKKSHSNINATQDRLRVLKNEIAVLETRVDGFVRALDEVLDEDEDLALVNLSRLITTPHRYVQPISQQILEEEGDEPEIILEAYTQLGLSTSNDLKLLKSQVQSTEELVRASLDATRNRLLGYNTILALASLSVALASMVGSFFGMNLASGLENTQGAFELAVFITLGGVLGIFALLSMILYRSGVM